MDKRAQAGTTAIVVTVITMIVMIVIGIVIAAEMTQAINITREHSDNSSYYGADAIAAYNAIVGHGWTAFTLLGILLLVVVGAGMIGVLLLLRR